MFLVLTYACPDFWTRFLILRRSATVCSACFVSRRAFALALDCDLWSLPARVMALPVRWTRSSSWRVSTWLGFIGRVGGRPLLTLFLAQELSAGG